MLLIVTTLFAGGCTYIPTYEPRGIENISLSSSNGDEDIYTITYTDGTTSTFTVTNGKNGADGTNGKDGEDGKDGASPVITIQDGYWYVDGINTNVLA